jgi:hypothetical protein
MLALAAVEGFERVIVNGLGVDVEDNLAWQALHQGIHWWLGFLEGLGVRVEVEGPSLFTLGEHAYGYGPSRYGKMRPGQAADPVRAANRRAINRRRVTRA